VRTAVTPRTPLPNTTPYGSPTYAKLGLTPTMDSEALLAKIKADHMCDKKAAKKVLAALDANDPDAALAARGDKAVVTL